VPEVWVSADQEIRMQVISRAGYQKKWTWCPDGL